MKASISYDEAITRLAADDEVIDRSPAYGDEFANRLAVAKRAAYAINKLLQEQWFAPPAIINNHLVELRDNPVVWLSDAINLMAFGTTKVEGRHHIEPPRVANFEEEVKIAQRRQAARALLGDPARKNVVGFVGSPSVESDQSDTIPSRYFDIPRNLGDIDNSVATDWDQYSDTDFCHGFPGKHQEWFNVRVAGPQFLSWLASQLSFGSDEDELAKKTHQEEMEAPTQLERSRPGAKPKYDWLDIQAFVFQMLDEKDDFKEWDTGDNWKGYADLNRLVVDYLERHGSSEVPSESTLKKRVRAMVAGWREQRSKGK
jgi:hypothetical protein